MTIQFASCYVTQSPLTRARAMIAAMSDPQLAHVTIREARPDEFTTIGDIAVAAYRSLGTEPEGYVDYLRDTAARAEAAVVLVAVDDGAGDERGRMVLGTVTYVPGPGRPLSEIEGEAEAGFRVLAVAPAAHGRGVGRAVVEAVVARARTDGKAGLAIFTRPSMKAAHHLYESLGFERDSSADWEFEPGEWLWAYRLRL